MKTPATALASLFAVTSLFAQAGTENRPLLDLPSQPTRGVESPDLPLIPDSAPAAEKAAPNIGKPPKTSKPNSTAVAEDDVKTHVRLREVRTIALRDPALQAEWERANAAKTEYGKREGLKRYYGLLYRRMEKIDPALKTAIAPLLAGALSRLDQTRIAPTVPPASL